MRSIRLSLLIYFLLLLAPGVEVAQDKVIARDVVLVVDVSGSMQGEKIDQAREGAAYVVEQLNPEDRFNVISFSTIAMTAAPTVLRSKVPHTLRPSMPPSRLRSSQSSRSISTVVAVLLASARPPKLNGRTSKRLSAMLRIMAAIPGTKLCRDSR